MTLEHGSESFFILGEGLVNTQVGGRRTTSPTRSTTRAPHEAAAASPSRKKRPHRSGSPFGPKGRAVGPA